VVQYDRTIPPGGEGKIELKVNTRNLSGTVKKEANIYSNDPKNSVMTITLRANVKQSVQVNPQRIKMIGYEGTVITQSVIISANMEKPLEIEPMRSNLSERVTHNIEVVEPGKIFKVNFNYTPLEGDNLNGELIIKTNYPERPNISIPVSARFIRKTTRKDNRSR
jgi:hypothetical protein